MQSIMLECLLKFVIPEAIMDKVYPKSIFGINDDLVNWTVIIIKAKVNDQCLRSYKTFANTIKPAIQYRRYEASRHVQVLENRCKQLK